MEETTSEQTDSKDVEETKKEYDTMLKDKWKEHMKNKPGRTVWRVNENNVCEAEGVYAQMGG